MNRVLIVSASPINRIVIARTVERLYLKPHAVAPDAAPNALRDCRPVLVIIDRVPEDTAPDPLLRELAQRRSASDQNLPRIVVIAGPSLHEGPPSGLIDAVVAKPITPDTLQPVVERLVAGLRDG